MSVFLLLLGIVTTAAGLALVVSGTTIHDGAFDTDVVTPGTIAAVGGLLLVGMGLAVRELRRIERVLAARPMPRPARPSEVPATIAPEQPGSAVRLPIPPKPTAVSPQQPASPTVSPAPLLPEDAAIERLRASFPTLARLEGGPVSEEADGSLMRRMPTRAGEDVIEAKNAAPPNRAGNGGSPARVVSRLDAKARTAPEKPKRSVFSAVWPVGARNTQLASAQVAAPLSQPSTEPVEPDGAGPNASPIAGQHAPEAPVFVLKSGVVEGMAYSLYSDGSIEAQLPQGTFRFSSITALRNHLESNS